MFLDKDQRRPEIRVDIVLKKTRHEVKRRRGEMEQVRCAQERNMEWRRGESARTGPLKVPGFYREGLGAVSWQGSIQQ